MREQVNEKIITRFLEEEMCVVSGASRIVSAKTKKTKPHPLT